MSRTKREERLIRWTFRSSLSGQPVQVKLVAGNALSTSFRSQIALKSVEVPLTMFVGKVRLMLERMSRRDDIGGMTTPELLVTTEPNIRPVWSYGKPALLSPILRAGSMRRN